MTRKTLGFILAGALVACASALAQQPVPLPTTNGGPTVLTQEPAKPAGAVTPPALSDVQKLQILNAAKDVEIWSLKTREAQANAEKAQAALQQLLASVTPAGYVLNERLELVKAPEAKKDK